MALCPFAVKKLIPAGSNDPSIKPRVAVLHVDAGNAYDLYNYFRYRSGGIESHFHIAKDGTIFQYRDTERQADANLVANDFGVSIETQGYGPGEWTPAQLRSIKRLLKWLNRVHPAIRLQVCDGPYGSGVGYHIQFGAPGPWTPVSKACPGADRIKQFNGDLTQWMRETRITKEDPMAAYDDELEQLRKGQEEILDAVLTARKNEWRRDKLEREKAQARFQALRDMIRGIADEMLEQDPDCSRKLLSAIDDAEKEEDKEK